MKLMVLIIAAGMVWTRPSVGASQDSTVVGERPKIGLALSGGGARGAAHIGVLRILEKYRVPVDYIAGTSMGAIVGGLYAAGLSADELETLIKTLDWSDAFTDWIRREDRSFRRKRDDDLYVVKSKPGVSGLNLKFPPGLIDGQKVDLLLKRHTLQVAGIRDFDELCIPFRAVAADLVTGEAVVIDHGDLALAIRASMSIPLAFAPREIDGRLLADGGVSCNLPIDVVRAMGADVVIAVDISTPLQTREQLQSVIAIANQLSGILTSRNSDLQLASLTAGDIAIHPDLGDITMASFDRAFEAIPAGVIAAEAAHARLSQLSLSSEDYERHVAARARPRTKLIVDDVRIVNQSRLSNEVIAARLNVPIGEPLDIEKLEWDINQIYGLELFESVSYDISEESDRTVLAITVRERSWGPNYLQSGVAVFEDYEGPNFNCALAYTRTAVNRLNGEWRTGVQVGREPSIFTEFYQPLSPSLRTFVHLDVSFGEQVENVFDSRGRRLSELSIRHALTGLAAGRELGTWGEIRAGVRRGAGDIRVQTGPAGVPDVEFDSGEIYVQFAIDRLDNVNFPRAGSALRIRLSGALRDLGSDSDFEQGTMETSYAYSVGRYTGLVRGLFASTRESDSPYQNLFRLGGFRRLSGFEENELAGQHAALLSATFYRRIGNWSFLTLNPGVSIEYGNVFQDRSAVALGDGILGGSSFIGIDTLLGPIYLAHGWAEGGRSNYYLFLGKSF